MLKSDAPPSITSVTPNPAGTGFQDSTNFGKIGKDDEDNIEDDDDDDFMTSIYSSKKKTAEPKGD